MSFPASMREAGVARCRWCVSGRCPDHRIRDAGVTPTALRYRHVAATLVASTVSRRGRERAAADVYALTPLECRQVLIETLQLIADGVVVLRSDVA